MKSLTFYFLLIFLLAFESVSFAQNSCERYEFWKKYVSGENNYISKVTMATDGGIILAGRIRNFQNEDALLLKINQQGVVEWSKTIATPNADQFQNVKQTSDGGYIAIGQTQTGSYSAFVCKFSSTGTLEWSKSYPAFSYNISHVSDIVELSSGGYALTTIYTSPFARSFVLRIDNTGTVVWGKVYTISPSLVSNSNNITQENDSLIVSGFCQTGPLPQDQFQYIMKVNINNGDVIRAKRWGYASADLFRYSAKKDGFLFANHSYNGTDHISLLNNSADIAGSIQLIPSIFDNKIETFTISSDTGIVIPKVSSNGNTFGFVKIKDLNSSTTKTITLLPGDYAQYPVITTNGPGDYIAAFQVSNGNTTKDIGLIKMAATASPSNPCNFSDANTGLQQTAISSAPFTWPLIEAYTLGSADISLQVNDIVFNTVEICNSSIPADCSSINITGEDTICISGAAFEYKAIRTTGCSTPVQFSTDNSFVQVTAASDSSISVIFLQEGTTKIYAQLTTPCGVYMDSLEILIAKNASGLTLGPDLNYCGTANFTLSAPPGFKDYTWQDGSHNISYIANSAGLFYLTVSDHCDNSFRDSVVIAETLPETIELGNDITICTKDTATLPAPPGFAVYQWSPDYNILSAFSQNAVVYPEITTKYILHAEKTAGSGCISIDSVTVHIYPPGDIHLPADTSLCMGHTLLLDAGPGFLQYNWNTGQSSQQISVSQAGEYIVNATDLNGCKSSDSFRINAIWNNPAVNISDDTSLCRGSTRILDAGNSGQTEYTWQDGSSASTYAVTDTGFYQVTVKDQNGCIASDAVYINKLTDPPAGFLDADTSVCFPAALTLSSLKNYKNYLWSTGAGTPTINVAQPGIYWLRVTDEGNCTGRDSIHITEKDCRNTIYFPNAFSPNNDGINDVFKPVLTGMVNEYLFIIYNRYGEIVFRSATPGHGWNGSFKGKAQNTGTFTWFCRFRFAGNTIEQQKGTLTLIR